tara:strand:+ start:411 stop:539 length:129 start_codon:yes stop_codon:yes gene_type:complete
VEGGHLEVVKWLRANGFYVYLNSFPWERYDKTVAWMNEKATD